MAICVRHGETALARSRSGARRGARRARSIACLLVLVSGSLAWASAASATPTVTLKLAGEGVQWRSLASEGFTPEWGYKVAISKGPQHCNPEPSCRETEYFEMQRSTDPQEFIPYAQNLGFTPQDGSVYIGVGELAERATSPPGYSEELRVPVVGVKAAGDPAPAHLWTEGDAVLWEGVQRGEWGYKIAISNRPRCFTSGCRSSEFVEVARGVDPQSYSPCLAKLHFTPIEDKVFVGVGTIQNPGADPPSYTGSEVAVTVPACPAPTVAGGAPSAISESAATLNATVNPNGNVVSDCHFDFGTSAAYGASVPCASPPPSGTSAVAVTGQLTGLSAGTTYHFRIVATGGNGTSHGADQTFATLEPPIPPTPTPTPTPAIPQVPPIPTTPLTSSLPPISPMPAPVNIVAPSIGGKAIAGYSVTPSAGIWEHTPTSYAYSWQLCDASGGACTTIDGTAGGPLTLAGADVGHRLRLSVVAGNAGGSTIAVSAPSPIVGAKVEAKFEWTFNRFAKYTIVEALHVVGIPPGGLVEVACRGRGCPFALAHLTPLAAGANCHASRCQPAHSSPSASSLNVASIFKRRHLRPGTVITVRVTRAGWVGRAVVFTVLANRDADHRSACLAPGSIQPGQGC
jgi:hypothetical protein